MERPYLLALVPRAAARAQADGVLRDSLLRWPLNPTHHLWRGLPACLGFPFLKTALVNRNPGGLPGLDCWPAVMRADPGALGMARGHLALLAPSCQVDGQSL